MGLMSSAEPVEIRPSYNVAPTQMAPVVRERGGVRGVSLLRWGLVPSWAPDLAFGNRCINARAEEAGSKPAFREAARSRRCLIPASGFYEWQAVVGQKVKQPWYFTVRDGLFAFGGLWETWNKEGAEVETFTILTGPPNAVVAPVHGRMPVIIRPRDYGRWLAVAEFESVAAVMAPYPAEDMEARRVSTRVNAPGNNDPSLIEPAA